MAPNGSSSSIDAQLKDIRDFNTGYSDASSKSKEKIAVTSSIIPEDALPEVTYRLYKQRFTGIIGMVVLNVVTAMSWAWFGPISNNMVDEFGITLTQVNWLGNIEAVIYLPVAIIVPILCSRYGIRRCCDIGVVALLISAWVRYAGTPRSLPTNGAYALLLIGQLFSSIAQPIFQVLGPKYSETWYNLNGRTTATMIIAISNPIGSAIGQLISPLVGDTRQSILVLGVISSAAVPFLFLIGRAPPTPPTYAGSKKSPSPKSLVKAMFGLETSPDTTMTRRERFDFVVITLVFGIFVAAVNSFGILTAQDLGPAGYSSDTAGFMGATLLLSGIASAILTAPLFDRVLTHHLAVTLKICVPILAGAWLSLVWAVKPNNAGGLYAIMVILGTGSMTLLPVSLELACELTRNADGSSAALWFSGNLFGVIFVLVEGALREGPDANPPFNMRRALIFNGAFIMATASLIFLVRGKQVRRELDEQKNAATQGVVMCERVNAV